MENEDIIRALKNGNVPSNGARELCIGRDDELNEFQRLLSKIDEEDKAYTKFLNGEFGAGKSFFLKVIEDIAFKNGFAVSSIILSDNLKFNKIEVVYRNIAKELRVKTGTSLEHILDRWYTHHYNIATQDSDNDFEKHRLLKERIHDELEETRQYSTEFANVIENYVKLRSNGDKEWAYYAISWIRGDATIPFNIKRKFGVKSEINRDNAFGFLEALSIFIKSIGYNGLVVLIDEIEFIKLLQTSNMRRTAYDNIRLIYDKCSVGEFQSALFVFAGVPDVFTDSKRGIPSYDALDERIKEDYKTDLIDVRAPIIVLKGLDKNNMQKMSQKLLNIHSKAYKWDAVGKVGPIVEDIIDEFVANSGLTGGKVTAREFVRKFISLLDKVEQNQSYFSTPEDILNEFINEVNVMNDDEFDEFDDDW